MRVYLPWLGEFGSELLFWVPAVYADRGEKVVCHELGKAQVYPDPGSRRYEVDRVTDRARKSNGALGQWEVFQQVRLYFGPRCEYVEPRRLKGQARRFFVPEARHKYPRERWDVVVFPRRRQNVATKNWKGWPDLVAALKSEGLSVFAAGHGDSSFKVPCAAAWDWQDPLDATIWALKHSRLRLGMMTALTVLSLMCGRAPLVLTTPDGKQDLGGKQGPNWKYLRECDHLKAGWEEVRLLGDVRGIVRDLVRRLKAEGLDERPRLGGASL